LFVVITADYFLAFLIDKHVGRKRLIFLIASILINVGILFFFKYFNFFNQNLSVLADVINWNYTPLLLHIALPIGLSFHVFQSLGYVIDVYKKKYTPETNYLTYALYVMFFPQLVAGPIERPQHLLPQLNQVHTFDPVLARKGLERMLWGFFKKLVIADQIGQMINPLFTNLPTQSSVLILMGILFTYQLYCDFSGYTDIALGAASMLGINLRENFNRPFAARTFFDFWRRWHMSLSTWFRDYVYISLGGSQVTKIKWVRNVLITFLLSGFWHGANWTFIIWGGLNGLYLVIEHLTDGLRKSIVRITGIARVPILHYTLQTSIVFLAVAVSFIFFRAENTTQAVLIMDRIISGIPEFSLHGVVGEMSKVVGNVVFLVTMLAVVLMEIVQYVQAKRETFFIFETKPRYIRYAWYAALTWSILLFGYFDAQTFIYFQF
jgi:D-alanyl-lipoteichoic acid acyltransferase DltB (MBOAT superfamily)